MDWRAVQKKNFSKIKDLAHFLEWDSSLMEKIWEYPRFVLNLPLRLAQKIQKNTLNDPILKQFVPLKNEQEQHPGFAVDPVQDETFLKGQKLLHKYEGRALLVCTSACAMHCRYCFRQNFDYETSVKGFEEELLLIRNDPSLKEILLSGGDPLSLSDKALFSLMDELAKIPHLKRIRFHTRFLIGIPERVTKELLQYLESYPLQILMVIHVNHANELDADVIDSIKQLQKLGIPILCQSVLLKGVNDSLEALQSLLESLADIGVIPYYLHQLDRVQGAAHFEVEEDVGHLLIEELRNKLPGYAIPRYVREIAGKGSKTELTSFQESLAPEFVTPVLAPVIPLRKGSVGCPL